MRRRRRRRKPRIDCRKTEAGAKKKNSYKNSSLLEKDQRRGAYLHDAQMAEKYVTGHH